MGMTGDSTVERAVDGRCRLGRLAVVTCGAKGALLGSGREVAAIDSVSNT